MTSDLRARRLFPIVLGISGITLFSAVWAAPLPLPRSLPAGPKERPAAPLALTINLTQFNLPGPPTELVSGAMQVVKWNATDPPAMQNTLLIRLYLSEDSGATFKLVAYDVANPAAGDGTFTWFVPNRPSPAGAALNCRFRVEAVNPATGMNDTKNSAAFRIRSAAAPNAVVPTNIRDFDMPGTQPAMRGAPIADPSNDCGNCHANAGAADEDIFSRWKGTMMANASIDPLFDACLEIANRDAPESGDLCIRCHVPKGWLEGRSSPTNGTALNMSDKIGVSCEHCHRMVDSTPPPGTIVPAEDAAILAALGAALQPMFYGNGMYVLDPNLNGNAGLDRRRGPWDIQFHGGHGTIQSGFFGNAALDPANPGMNSTDAGASAMCGTCHDVSNQVFEVVTNGGVPVTPRRYQPKANFGVASTNFDPRAIMPIERTYSEWFASAFRQAPINIPGYGNVQHCTDCHMMKVVNKVACTGGSSRTLHMHDHTGGNTFITRVLRDEAEFLPFFTNNAERMSVFGGLAAPNNAGSIDRAFITLQKAATLDATISNDLSKLTVKVTNNTGHKLPTGYPEGRRMWLNVRFFKNGNLIRELGGYQNALLDMATTRVYEAEIVTDGINGIADGSHFHFVLGNKIRKDNRIPPRGFTNAGFDAFGAKPIDTDPLFNGRDRYNDGDYFDFTDFPVTPAGDPPLCPDYAEVRLYYQTASKEYIDFLNANAPTKGPRMKTLWENNGKSEPVEMAFKRVDFPAGAPAMLSANSIKTHGMGQNAQNLGASILLVNGPNGPSTEPRMGGVTQLVLAFDQPVVPVNGTMPVVTVVSTVSGNLNPIVQGFGSDILVVTLPAGNAPDCLKITVDNLMGECSQAAFASVSFYVRSALGDTTNNGRVTSADVAQVQSVLNQQAGTTNFRMDVNLDGVIDNADFDIVRMQSGQCNAPACPP